MLVIITFELYYLCSRTWYK